MNDDLPEPDPPVIPTEEDILALMRDVFTPATNGSHPTEQNHTWEPIDLLARDTGPPEPPTISRLIYPGRRHLLSGEPETLKSWAAMIICAEQIRAGRTAAYIDFEMGARETLARLRDLQLTDQELTDGFIYIEPAQPFWDAGIRDDTDRLLLDRNPSIIIIDAMTGALQTHSLDPNRSIDIELFYRGVIDPLRHRGAATVILDHLPKDTLNRGKFAIGSERKIGGVEVHLGFETIVPFGRGRTGRAKLTTWKDRPGWLPRPRAAELELKSNDDSRITWQWHEAEENQDTDGNFRPTVLMDKTSRWLETQPEPQTLNSVENAVSGKAEYLRKAIEALSREGYINETQGPRNSRLFTSHKAYREDQDPLLHPDLVPPRPDLVPDEVQHLVPRTPPPLGGDEVPRTNSQHKNQPTSSQQQTNTDDDIPF